MNYSKNIMVKLVFEITMPPSTPTENAIAFLRVMASVRGKE